MVTWWRENVKAENEWCAVSEWNATQLVTYLCNINYTVPCFWIIEQTYLTRLNYLVAASPNVYNRINNSCTQVVKLWSDPHKGKFSSPTQLESIQCICTLVCICPHIYICMFLLYNPALSLNLWNPYKPKCFFVLM